MKIARVRFYIEEIPAPGKQGKNLVEYGYSVPFEEKTTLTMDELGKIADQIGIPQAIMEIENRRIKPAEVVKP